MKILVVAATYSEIAPLLREYVLINKNDRHFSSFRKGKKEIDTLITGVGLASTAYHLGKVFSTTKYDYALNLGIAGAFSRKIKTGSVVNVVSDIISEMGAENRTIFLKFDALKMSRQTMERTAYFTKNNTKIKNKEIAGLPVVKGITVNTVHGNKNSISKIKKLFSPDVETMEGAAFLYACNHEKIKCVQIRSISNYVEERNIEKWNTALAIKNLNETAIKIIDSLKK